MVKRFTCLPLFLLLIVLAAFCPSANGQAHYLPCQDVGFQVLADTELTGRHTAALSTANLESYRLRDTSRILTFEDGIQFKLPSAKELSSQGCDIELESYPLQRQISQAVSLIFQLTPENRITLRSEIDSRFKLANLEKDFSAHPRQIISNYDLENLSKSKRKIIDRILKQAV